MQVFSYGLIAYAIFKKGELSVIYLLVYLFAGEVVTSNLSASIGYLTLTLLLSYYFIRNLPFVLKNFFTVLITLYFLLLLINVDNLVKVRPYIFGSVCLFLLIGILPEIYRKFSRDKVFHEVGNASLLVLIIFCSNSFFSTLFNYNPHLMYGISSGVLYGNLIHADFHILPLVSFVVLRRAIKNKSLGLFLIFVISFLLILLTFRRTVMVLTALGCLIVIIELVSFKNFKKLLIVLIVLSSIGLIIVQTTGFLEVFWERYELRNLDDRDLEKEGRVQELELVYKDIFVHFDYSPWIGYGLFQLSGKNYGKGIFGDRPLHTDMMVLIHSSGIIGLILYLLMVSYAFLSVWIKSNSREDIVQFIYVLIVFLVFFGSGRFTNTASSLIIYLVLFLPFSKEYSYKLIK